MNHDDSADSSPIVACLCAAWCRLCDDYAPLFEQALAQARRSQPALRGRWIDIEDEAELLGDVDVETFPTLLVVVAGVPRFFGSVEPQPAVIERVLRHAFASDGAAAEAGDAVRALARRLAAG